MNRRTICSGSLEVSRLGLGCSRFGSAGGIGPRTARRLLLRALELGVNLFDTANVYGQGDSETIIGRTLQGRRDEAVIVTKAGYPMPEMNLARRIVKPFSRPVLRRVAGRRRVAVQAPATVGGADRFRVAALRASLESSLRRLQTDHVDIFFLHSLPDGLIGHEELLSFLQALRQEGKARAVGFSMTRFPKGLGRLLDERIDLVGSAVNAVATDNLAELPGLDERDVPVLGYQVFASGALLDRQRRGIDTTGPGRQLGLALRQPGVVSAVAGASSVRQLEQNVRAVEALP